MTGPADADRIARGYREFADVEPLALTAPDGGRIDWLPAAADLR